MTVNDGGNIFSQLGRIVNSELWKFSKSSFLRKRSNSFDLGCCGHILLFMCSDTSAERETQSIDDHDTNLKSFSLHYLMYRNRNRNLKTFKALLKRKAQQGTSL